MLTQSQKARTQLQMLCIDDLVPKNHILRDIDASLDFSFIYDEVKELYCADNGRPSIDPVILVKIPLIQYIFGIRSMRQTIRDIEVNMAYRWFLGLDICDAVPHFTTFGKNYIRRFAETDVFERIFSKILQEAVNCGFVDASAIFLDGTHIKASANKKKATNAQVEVQAKHYQKQLNEEINADRLAHGKKPLKGKDDDENPPMKNIKQSTTDPDCGLFHKGEHKVEFAYVAQVACDRNNFILGFDLAPGNAHDSVMFDDLYARTIEQFPEVEAVGIDAAYKTPWIAKQVFDSGRKPCLPYKRPMTKKGFFRKYEYVYDEYYDCVICPENQVLKYSTTNKEGYKEFKSDSKICKNCPSRAQCTGSKNCQKVVCRHVWEDYIDLAEDVRHSKFGRETYDLRSRTIERVFGDAKEKHNMRYTQYRGKERVSLQVLLTFACMNLKKLAKWKRINGLIPSILWEVVGILFVNDKRGCHACA